MHKNQDYTKILTKQFQCLNAERVQKTVFSRITLTYNHIFHASSNTLCSPFHIALHLSSGLGLEIELAMKRS